VRGAANLALDGRKTVRLAGGGASLVDEFALALGFEDQWNRKPG